jgi:NTE family protein
MEFFNRMLKFTTFLQRCAAIKKIPVFTSLSWYRIQQIARAGEILRCLKNDHIVQKGHPPDFIYFLVSGRLISYTPEYGGHKNDIEFIHRGMFFGIISALTGETHSQSFSALNDSVLFRIPVSRFRRILKKSPDLGLKFSKILSQRIRNKLTKTGLTSRSTVVSVYAPITGSGASTYAFNLALALKRETGDRTIFVTISSFKSKPHAFVSDMEDVCPKWRKEPVNLGELAHDIEQIPAAIIKSDTGIDWLNAAFDPTEQDLVQHISDFVSSFLEDYRFIIVDLPSELDEIVMKTLSQSDLIHIVSIRKREVLKMARATLDTLEEHLKDDFNINRVKVIISGAQAHGTITEETVTGILDYDVTAFLPHIQRADLALEVDTVDLQFFALGGEAKYWAAVSHIARQMAGVSVGLVLGGGAAFGLAHIGVIKVLEEEGVRVDIIAGSSMGALIGALWAVGYRWDEIEKMAYEFKDKMNLFRLLDIVFPLSGFISGKAVTAWLEKKFQQRTFKDIRIPLKIVAYDLIHRQDIIIEHGSLAQAIRKSISIPGVFEPIFNDDQLIIDGGVMNPLPTDVIALPHVRKLIAVNVLQSPDDVIRGYQKMQKETKMALAEPFLKDPWYFLDVRLQAWFNRTFFPSISNVIVRTLEASESVIAEQSALAADITIHPDLSGLNWYELYNAEELIKRGEEAARKHIHLIKELFCQKK